MSYKSIYIPRTHLAIGQRDLQDIQLLVAGWLRERHGANQADGAAESECEELLSARLPHAVSVCVSGGRECVGVCAGTRGHAN